MRNVQATKKKLYSKDVSINKDTNFGTLLQLFHLEQGSIYFDIIFNISATKYNFSKH